MVMYPSLALREAPRNQIYFLGGPAGEFPANIFEPGKISEKVSRANNNKKQAETSGPRTDGGERFRP